MTPIRNARSYPLEIAATGETVDPGATIDVDDDLARSLLEQPDNWQTAKATKAKAGATEQEQ